MAARASIDRGAVDRAWTRGSLCRTLYFLFGDSTHLADEGFLCTARCAARWGEVPLRDFQSDQSRPLLLVHGVVAAVRGWHSRAARRTRNRSGSRVSSSDCWVRALRAEPIRTRRLRRGPRALDVPPSGSRSSRPCRWPRCGSLSAWSNGRPPGGCSRPAHSPALPPGSAAITVSIPRPASLMAIALLLRAGQIPWSLVVTQSRS